MTSGAKSSRLPGFSRSEIAVDSEEGFRFPTEFLVEAVMMENGTGTSFANAGVALVTGASSGIGTASAVALAEKGWMVICAARRLDRLESLTSRLGERSVPVQLDISDAASIRTLTSRIPEKWQSIDVLVNCAGQDIGGRHQFDLGSIEQWVSTVQTNAIGTMRVTHAIVSGMMDRGRGHIINVGSTSSTNAYAGGAAYVASKFAINGFTKSILADYRGKGVRVSHVMPGLTRTEFVQTRLGGTNENEEENRAKAQQFYESYSTTLAPEDVARAIVYAIEQPPHVTIAEILILPSS